MGLPVRSQRAAVGLALVGEGLVQADGDSLPDEAVRPFPGLELPVRWRREEVKNR